MRKAMTASGRGRKHMSVQEAVAMTGVPEIRLSHSLPCSQRLARYRSVLRGQMHAALLQRTVPQHEKMGASPF
jgi:hypothetical protein